MLFQSEPSCILCHKSPRNLGEEVSQCDFSMKPLLRTPLHVPTCSAPLRMWLWTGSSYHFPLIGMVWLATKPWNKTEERQVILSDGLLVLQPSLGDFWLWNLKLKVGLLAHVEFWSTDLVVFAFPAAVPGRPAVVRSVDGGMGCLCHSTSTYGILFQSDSSWDDHKDTSWCQQVQGQAFILSHHVAWDQADCLKSLTCFIDLSFFLDHHSHPKCFNYCRFKVCFDIWEGRSPLMNLPMHLFFRWMLESM